mmetsp:Transcript_36153/g.83320  ORF Transcript_36153/g.83320 Transcript_36153/m.83320 type:complete len:347 (+) Transcript_36153:53-1093(+)
MAEVAQPSPGPSRDLAAPRVRDGLMDEKAVKRANRLAGVGQTVGNMDLKAVAETYKSQNGGSGIEAAAAAAAALGAALKASMTGGPVDTDECLKVAQREMQKVAVKKAREAKGEAVLQERLAAVGYEGQAKSEALRMAHQQRAMRAVTEKNERLADDVATRRAMREERAAAAASRRCLSEARAKFVRRWPQPEEADDAGPSLPSLLADDPVVRRARALCSGAAQAVAQLEEQNQMIKSKPALQQFRSEPKEPKVISRGPTPIPSNEELIAKAKELLADYKPEKLRAPASGRTSSARTTAASAESSTRNSPRHGAGGGSDLTALQRARQQCADVCVELATKKETMRR